MQGYFIFFFRLRTSSLAGRTKTSSRNSDVNLAISKASSRVTSFSGSSCGCAPQFPIILIVCATSHIEGCWTSIFSGIFWWRRMCSCNLQSIIYSFLFTHITMGTDLETWWDTESADNIGFGHHNCGFYVARVYSKILWCLLPCAALYSNFTARFRIWHNLAVGRNSLPKTWTKGFARYSVDLVCPLE